MTVIQVGHAIEIVGGDIAALLFVTRLLVAVTVARVTTDVVTIGSYLYIGELSVWVAYLGAQEWLSWGSGTAGTIAVIGVAGVVLVVEQVAATDGNVLTALEKRLSRTTTSSTERFVVEREASDEQGLGVNPQNRDVPVRLVKRRIAALEKQAANSDEEDGGDDGAVDDSDGNDDDDDDGLIQLDDV
jgi:phage gp37-like protein